MITQGERFILYALIVPVIVRMRECLNVSGIYLASRLNRTNERGFYEGNSKMG
ncbi:MAG: hypothetical protein ACI9NY_002241 [Kiritimatiellia bacterium]|jgi:hypothetical protein